MRFKPVRAPRTFEEVAAQVVRQVEMGQLKPGDKLPSEREFARQLEVSRSAVREALRTLENAGVVILRMGSKGGAFIAEPNERIEQIGIDSPFRIDDVPLSDLSDARLAILDAIARIACERRSDLDADLLEENIRTAERLYREGRMQEKAEKNLEFYELLAKATKNVVLERIMSAISDLLRQFSSHVGPERSVETFRLRRQFVKALRNRDSEAAVSTMQRNLLRSHREYARIARAMHARPRRTGT